uniref:Intraflagellar transport protein 57 homolog n=1 Tax=Heterorhabditis bacteriophora TaxID=37862 RepID=A0A1I7W8V8_HETBA
MFNGELQEVAVDFAANKLKNGAGEQSLYVLDSLADLALVYTGFKWQKMIPPVVEDEDVEVDREEEEIMADEIEEAELDFVEDDDDTVLVDLAAPSLTETQVRLSAYDLFLPSKYKFQDRPLQTILKSDTNVISWKEEVERVTPHLKITIRQDAKDWRMHLEQMNTMHKNMTELFEQVGPQLEQITGEVEKSLERIESRERTINQQLGGLLSKFKETQDSRAEVRERYKSASIGVTERTETLQRISEDIDQIKEQIEEQGAKTSDGGHYPSNLRLLSSISRFNCFLFSSPMLKVKQALLKIEEDIERMNVQIGVIEQNLLQAQLRVRVAYAAEAYGAN